MQLIPAESVAGDVAFSLPQYSRWQVVLIWGAAAVPMALLGWIVNPPVAGPIDGKAVIPGTAQLACARRPPRSCGSRIPRR